MGAFSKEKLDEGMQAAVKAFQKNLSGLRTGRASPALLEKIMVEAYGARTPLDQLGTINAPEPRLLTVQVWDESIIKAVERSIRDANVGLNPSIDGKLVRVPLPELTQERRKDLVKQAHAFAEEAKKAIRMVRREGMETVEEMEKNKLCSEDERTLHQKEIQKMTDDYGKKIEDLLIAREKEILTV